MSEGSTADEESRPDKGRGDARRASNARLEQLGRALESAIERRASLRAIDALQVEILKGGLIDLVVEELERRALPLPEVLIAAIALQHALIDRTAGPRPRDFLTRFRARVDSATQHCQRRRLLIDRESLEANGVLSRRAHAQRAALVQATIQLPFEERRLVAGYVMGLRTPQEIADSLRLSEATVRRAIASVLRNARRALPEWERRIALESQMKSPRGRRLEP